MNEAPKPADPVVDSIKSWRSSRSKIVSASHSPLGFFVLALLIVEALLFGAGTWFGLSESWKVAVICVGIILFLVVFGAVVWLVIRYPQNLVFGEESHVQYAAMKIYGTENRDITGYDVNSLPQDSPPEAPGGQIADKSEGDE